MRQPAATPMPESVRRCWGDDAVHCTDPCSGAWHHKDYHKPRPDPPRLQFGLSLYDAWIGWQYNRYPRELRIGLLLMVVTIRRSRS